MKPTICIYDYTAIRFTNNIIIHTTGGDTPRESAIAFARNYAYHLAEIFNGKVDIITSSATNTDITIAFANAEDKNTFIKFIRAVKGKAIKNGQ